MSQNNIRNFAIIAHIDHGKSTLADRLLEATKTVEKRLMTNQLLDSNPIERERGITIKLAPVRMGYGRQSSVDSRQLDDDNKTKDKPVICNTHLARPQVYRDPPQRANTFDSAESADKPSKQQPKIQNIHNANPDSQIEIVDSQQNNLTIESAKGDLTDNHKALYHKTSDEQLNDDIVSQHSELRIPYSNNQPTTDNPSTQGGSASGGQPTTHNRQSAADKSQSATDNYILNLIDTPGHVDFSYEVSRSLAACEGAILVVDATQGVQAQTLAHLNQAGHNKLKIIPVINKIDIPTARIDETKLELIDLGFKPEEIIEISAKSGTNVEQVLEAIIQRIPPPQGIETIEIEDQIIEAPLRALVFSSQYDAHKGVIVFVRVVDGCLTFKGSTLQGVYSNLRLRFMASGVEVAPIEVGYFSPKMKASNGLTTGEVGYIATGLKDIRFAKVGDTITFAQIKNQISKIKMTYQKAQLYTKQTVSLSVESTDSVEEVDKQSTLGQDQGEQSTTANPPHRQTSPQATTNNLQPTTYNLQPLPGYKEPKPMVFLSLFPVSADEFTASREAMEKLRLSDSAFTFRPISSAALGNGFHCGFLGLLHAEIVQERILREFDLTMIATAPSVEYHLTLQKGINISKYGFTESQVINNDRPESSGPDAEFQKQDENVQEKKVNNKQQYNKVVLIQSASEYPDPSIIDQVEEPMMEVKIFTPKRYVGAIMQLATEKRGDYIDLVYHGDNAEFTYLIPLAEMIIDFFDRLKSVTEGYASLDYRFFDWQEVELSKVDILLNHEKVDALSFLVVRVQAQKRAREIVERLSEVIPRQQFNIPVQGTIGGTVIARSDIKPFRKDVIQKLYGGDRTRKDKLLKKQKKGKAKMKLIGRVEIPQTAFFEVLKRE